MGSSNSDFKIEEGQVSESSLTIEEREVALKALGFYQVHLYDALSSKKEDELGAKKEIQREISLATTCIKKLHKMQEIAQKR